VACPQVPEISSVAHQPSCFGFGFLLCWFTGGLFLCLSPFLWGKVSDSSASPQLSPCCDGLLLVFQFAVLFDFGCCSLAQKMSFVDHYLPYFRQWFIIGPLLAFLPFQPLFTEGSHGDQLLAFPSSPVHLQHPAPLLCVSFQFLVYSVFFFLWGRGSVCSGGYAGLSQVWLGEYWCLVLTCWSAKCLSSRFGASIWQHGSSPVFSV
jgi:hypothetical protein